MWGWIITIGIIVLGVIIGRNSSTSRGEQSPKIVRKIGQQSSINDVFSALSDIENRYRRFHRMLYDNDYDFGHFLALSDYQKEMILEPLKQVMECGQIHFLRFPRDNNQYSNHYDFYVGELNQNRTPKFGVYSWEWEEDEEKNTSIDYFAGSFENGQPKHGVWYHLSNEDAKIWVRVDGRFYISAINGVSVFR